MNKNFIVLAAVVFIGAVVIILQATHETKALVLTPSEVTTQATHGSLERIRVGGKVTNEEILYQLEPDLELRFSVEDPAGSKPLPVVYKGLKPDMFAPGRSVMIDGDYVNGTLIAAKLLTQCPSKYEPPSVQNKDAANEPSR